jgi:alanyl-tRNA synthetase
LWGLINRHVAKTGDIKRFVLLEESAIAKGIRRIVAATGEGAAKAQATANVFQLRLKSLGEMKSGGAMDRELKTIGTELEQALLPFLDKARMKLEFAALKKQFIASEKVRLAKETKEVVDQVKLFFTENPDKKVLVRNVGAASGKALSQALIHVKSLKDCAALLIAVDSSDESKVVHHCYVPTGRGIKASELADVVAGVVGGKAGGRDESAMGSGNEVGKVDEALVAAMSFLKL